MKHLRQEQAKSAMEEEEVRQAALQQASHERELAKLTEFRRSSLAKAVQLENEMKLALSDNSDFDMDAEIGIEGSMHAPNRPFSDDQKPDNQRPLRAPSPIVEDPPEELTPEQYYQHIVPSFIPNTEEEAPTHYTVDSVTISHLLSLADLAKLNFQTSSRVNIIDAQTFI
ncbi:hypothetical protein APHAL10511_003913 [Amanita phalloides]|nr:hypothetical protein APHAL10511_003913 [Amanita phalloides]